TLWAWGVNGYGQLGLGTYASHTSPTRVGTATNWASVSAGKPITGFTLATRTDGSLWAWGDNGWGELAGDGTVSHGTLSRRGSAIDWASVATGHYHTVAVKNDGTLWAWGANQNGQLGVGTLLDHGSPVQVGTDSNWASAAVGEFHTMAV